MNTQDVSYLGEVWKDIPKFENEYQASNKGRIRSLDRWVENNGGLMFVKGKILKPRLSNKGYPIVCLCKNGKAKNYNVHRLVYETFIGEIPEGMQVNHKDENKENNVLSNIDTLMTCKENINYGTRNEKYSRKIIQKTLQGEVIRIWSSGAEVEKELGYSKGNICECCNGKRKTHKGYLWQYTEEKATA